jgi:septum formation topological specificity factor MinE
MSGFYFNTKFTQTILLGKKAKNLRELLEGIKTVPLASIYYHTHRFLQQHQSLSPEPPNDFAYWIAYVLNEEVLGEQVSSIDIIQFNNMDELRRKFMEVIDTYLQTATRVIDCPNGHEFHFMAAKSFLLQTNYVANDLTEFKDILQKISISSLYFHIFDARLRLEKKENDFSIWFRDNGKEELANELSRLDPYTYTLEGLREKIIKLVEKYGQT